MSKLDPELDIVSSENPNYVPVSFDEEIEDDDYDEDSDYDDEEIEEEEYLN